MAKSFTFPLKGSPAERISHARAEAQKAGATFNGDERSGHFNGHGVAGEYRTEGTQVVITINSKPFFAPWPMIESKLQSFFA